MTFCRLCFQDGIGNAARIREPSSELSILTMYDAQVGHLILKYYLLILVISLIWSFLLMTPSASKPEELIVLLV